MKLYKTKKGILLQKENELFLLQHNNWDVLINRNNLFKYLSVQLENSERIDENDFKNWTPQFIQAPVQSQEVWAAGVTYLRSRDARMEESKESGAADCYDKVYAAERPELFFKALPQRVAAHGSEIFIRRDSSWNVPEPELTLFTNTDGKIEGYTIGNDVSSRSIEGENPLYLPQAKVYEKSAALGPCLYVPQQPLSQETSISIEIKRGAKQMYKDAIQLSRMKRSFAELAEFLYRECIFPHGCFLMTGTGLIPPPDFSLQVNDEVYITIDEIGTLSNRVSERRL